MRNRQEFLSLWFVVFLLGQVVVNLMSFLFGSMWFAFWLLGQLALPLGTLLLTGLLFSIKERDEM